MALGDSPHDGEPDAGARELVARVEPMERPEEARGLAGREADAVVGDPVDDAPAGCAPAARISATDSRTAVPAVITSSTTSTRPASGAPTTVPPSPWSLASLRL